MMPRFDNLLLGYMLFRNLKHLVIIILCACFISSCNQSISYKRPQLLANFGSFECNTNKLSNVNYSNIWNKIRNGFCLDTVHSPRIDKEIKWFGKPCETSEQQWASPYTVYTSGCFAK